MRKEKAASLLPLGISSPALVTDLARVRSLLSLGSTTRVSLRSSSPRPAARLVFAQGNLVGAPNLIAQFQSASELEQKRLPDAKNDIGMNGRNTSVSLYIKIEEIFAEEQCCQEETSSNRAVPEGKVKLEVLIKTKGDEGFSLLQEYTRVNNCLTTKDSEEEISTLVPRSTQMSRLLGPLARAKSAKVLRFPPAVFAFLLLRRPLRDQPETGRVQQLHLRPRREAETPHLATGSDGVGIRQPVKEIHGLVGRKTEEGTEGAVGGQQQARARRHGAPLRGSHRDRPTEPEDEIHVETSLDPLQSRIFPNTFGLFDSTEP
ncbi:hypothetical protein MUK42_11917 [Musa troglodytarum]|uniref:Uncharacterized protein n=1 Tax=Musa troglodytarum TaxID=320322 RepID=A0A9E7I0L8_9LILI|nr:hypothetical protein MUK42_11917 [Musa troglodytarum]